MTGITVHGNIPFDVPFVSEIAPNMWQGGCQNGLVLPPFIKHLVSLYPWEAYEIRHEIHSGLAILMYDRIDQEFSRVDAIAAWVNACRDDGPTLVHCQAGLNRSSFVAARALVLDLNQAQRLRSAAADVGSPCGFRGFGQAPGQPSAISGDGGRGVAG